MRGGGPVARGDVGMVAPREPLVGALDVARGRAALQAEQAVEIHGTATLTSLLALVDDLRVDDAALRASAFAGRRARCGRPGPPAGRALRLAIQRLGGLVLRGGQRVERALNRRRVLTFD